MTRRGGLSGQYGFSPMMDSFLKNIDEYGWTMVHVAPREGDPPPHQFFGYTAGFTELGQPEVLMFGLEDVHMHSIFSTVYKMVKEESLQLAHGTLLPEETLTDPTYRLAVCRVTGDHEANVARAIYGENVEVVQLIWPDVERRFPWDEGYAVDTDAQGSWWVWP